MIRRTIAAVAVVGALVGAAAGRTSPLASPLRAVVDIPLPGPATRFDYQAVDTSSSRLYVSHMNAGEVIVFDLARRRVVSTIVGLPRATGVCAVPALGKLYVSVPGRHHVAVIDARTLAVTARVGDIGFPDGIAYAPEVQKVYVSDESGGGELVIDGATDRVVTTIALGGEAGNTIYDPVSKRVFVAVQTSGEWVEIDPRSDRVVARHPLAGAAGPHGMALDAAGRLLFVASEDNATLQTVDLGTMQVVETHGVGDEPDVLAFDPAWRRLYVATESGKVSVFSERGGRLVAAGDVTMPHAHTVTVDPRTHLLYLPLQDVGGHPLLRIMVARRP